MSAVEDLYATGDGPEIGPDEDEQKITVADKAPFGTSTPYWREKLNVCKIVASEGETVYLKEILARMYGRDGAGTGSNAYQRVRRFLNSNPNFFRVRRSDGFVSASPTLELLDLIKRGIIQRGPEEPATAGSQFEGNRDFAESLLKSIRWDRGEQSLINDDGRDLLEDNLGEYLERINDLRLVLRSDYADPEYLTLPYKTRFNDPGRISKQHAIMGKSLEKAAEMHEHAALLTLTTDPKKFSSAWEMWTEINDNWNRFMSWLASDRRLGERPDYIKVLEATEKGMPHIHAIVFLDEDQTRYDGMPWLESKSEISSYWGKYQGTTVDVQPLTYEDDLPDEYDKDAGWVRWQEDGDHGGDLGGGDGGGQTAGEYLGKYLSAIYGGIRGAAGLEDSGPTVMTDGGEPVASEEVTEKYEDKAATWKVAMYWATRRKIRTESRDLRQAVEEDMEDEDEEEKAELAEQIRENRYEFVGAYEYGQIPSHISNGAVPIDSLMESLREALEAVDAQAASDPAPERTKEEIIQRVPAAARPLFEDEPAGAGMLFDDDRDDGPDLEDDHADEQGDALDYPEQVLTDEERAEAEEKGGFGNAADFM